MLDHGQNPRLGQRPVPASTGIQKLEDADAYPENPFHGQVTYRVDAGTGFMWDDEDQIWRPLGIEFYYQTTAPEAAGYAALWLEA